MHGPLQTPVAVAAPERTSFWSWRTLAYWSLSALFWGCYFWSEASGEAIFASVPWRAAQLMWGTVAVVHFALLHAVRWSSKRFGWLSLSPRNLLWRIVAAVVVVSWLVYLTMRGMSLYIYGSPVAPIMAALYQKLPLGNQLFNQYVFALISTTAWISAYFAVVFQRQRHQEHLRRAQLDDALRTAELRLLKSQLNPHFLFNALNGVRALIADEPSKAQDAVTQLARTLRYTLAAGDTDLVTLASEMEMVDDYLALESMRLAERLRIVRDITPEAAQAPIPVMLLQTLVENGIKHGVAQVKQGGTLRISARLQERELLLEVENPRPPVPQATAYSQGVGFRNSSERLRLLFGSAATLHLDLTDPMRAIARVRLPMMSADAA
jgi:sensor histidine kinase YesM